MRKSVLAAAVALMASLTLSIGATEKSYTLSFEKSTASSETSMTANNFIETAMSGGTEYVTGIYDIKLCFPDDGCIKLAKSNDGYVSFSLKNMARVRPTRVVVSVKHTAGKTLRLNYRKTSQSKSSLLQINSVQFTKSSGTEFEDVELKNQSADIIGVLRVTGLKGIYVKSVTVYYEETEASSVNDISTQGTYIVNQELAGMAVVGDTLYCRTLDPSATQPSVSTYTGSYTGEIGKTSYEDNDLSKFTHYDWVAVDNTSDMKMEAGYIIRAGFTAQYDGKQLIPVSGFTPSEAAPAIELNEYRAENILHGQFSNYNEGDYPAFYVRPRANEVADFHGYVENVDGAYYLYSAGANGKLNGKGVRLVGEVDIDAIGNSMVKFTGVAIEDASANGGMYILLTDKVGAGQIYTAVETAKEDDANVRVWTCDGTVSVVASEAATVNVYDISGRAVRTTGVQAGETAQLKLGKGYYIVKVGTTVKRIIVD